MTFVVCVSCLCLHNSLTLMAHVSAEVHFSLPVCMLLKIGTKRCLGNLKVVGLILQVLTSSLIKGATDTALQHYLNVFFCFI